MPLAEKWHIDFDHAVGYPLIVNNRVFVTVAASSSEGGAGARLFALDASSGAILWGPIQVGGSPYYSGAYLTADSQRVYAVDRGGNLRAIDQTDGHVVWHKQLDTSFLTPPFSSPPNALDGVVYVLSGAGALSAVSTATGTVLWTVSIVNGGPSSPIVTANAVYISGACDWAYRFNRTSGANVWTRVGPCAGGGGLTSAIHNNRMFVRDGLFSETIVDIATGTDVGTFDRTAALAFDGNREFYLWDGVLSMLDRTGAIDPWSTSGVGSLSTPPVVINGKVFVASSSNLVSAYAENTGNQLWSADTGQPAYGLMEPAPSLAVANGILLVPATNRLVAYG